MNSIGIGVIGCGVMGRRHAEVASQSEGMRLAAVADVRREAAQTVGEQFGAGAVYDSAAALLADRGVDAVMIALPAGLRTAPALAALAAGKHVLLEKPVALNTAEARQLQAARGNLVVGVCSCRYRFWESARVATKLVADGELGDIRVVHFRGTSADRGPIDNPPSWRVSHKLNGGGIWVNWGCYDLDYVMGITGWQLKPRLVLAQTWPVAPHLPSRVAPGSDADEHAIALVQCEGGAVLSMERGEAMSLDAPSTWQIIGSRASLRLDMLQDQDNQVILDRTHADGPLTTHIVWRGDNDNDARQLGPIEDFARAIRENGQPMTDLDQALVMQQITDAIYQSATEKRAVAIE